MSETLKNGTLWGNQVYWGEMLAPARKTPEIARRIFSRQDVSTPPLPEAKEEARGLLLYMVGNFSRFPQLFATLSSADDTEYKGLLGNIKQKCNINVDK